MERKTGICRDCGQACSRRADRCKSCELKLRRAGIHNRPVMPEMERFMAKVDIQPSGCWNWLGSISEKGYSHFMTGNKRDGSRRIRRAHIVAYELFVGPIPKGLQLDHTCRSRRCVNPAHLEVVTNRENSRRGNTGKYGRARGKVRLSPLQKRLSATSSVCLYALPP